MKLLKFFKEAFFDGKLLVCLALSFCALAFNASASVPQGAAISAKEIANIKLMPKKDTDVDLVDLGLVAPVTVRMGEKKKNEKKLHEKQDMAIVKSIRKQLDKNREILEKQLELARKNEESLGAGPDPITNPLLSYRKVILPPNVSQKSYNRDNWHLTPVRFVGENVSDVFKYAAEFDKIDTLRVILQTTDFVNVLDSNGDSPLFYAVNRGNGAAVEILLHYGVDPNILNRYGVSAVHIAAQRVDSQIVTSLIKAGADANLQDFAGRTPLMYAIESGAKDTVIALLENGADPNFISKYNERPIDIAIDSAFFNIADILIRKGATTLYRLTLNSNNSSANLQ